MLKHQVEQLVFPTFFGFRPRESAEELSCDEEGSFFGEGRLCDRAAMAAIVGSWPPKPAPNMELGNPKSKTGNAMVNK